MCNGRIVGASVCIGTLTLAAHRASALTLSDTDINTVFSIAAQKYTTYYNSNIAGHSGNLGIGNSGNIIPLDSSNNITNNTESSFAVGTATDWRAGFYAGVMWETYGRTGNTALLTDAENMTFAVQNTIAYGDHDVGFRTLTTYVQGAQYLGGNFVYSLNGVTDQSYDTRIVQAATFLANRYIPAVGATRSWNDGAPAQTAVIVDNMMNIQLLFQAQQLGAASPIPGMSFSDIAIQHARTTFNDFVRTDAAAQAAGSYGSSVHEVVFDTASGNILYKQSAQGITSFGQWDPSQPEAGQPYATQGCWSRGQAWLINGFTSMYTNTNMPEFLSDAQTVANYWCMKTLQNVSQGASYVPPTDFDVALVGTPDDPNHQDASAAAIAADGLLQLADYTTDPTLRAEYWSVAVNTLEDLLAAPYFNSATNRLSLLTHAAQQYQSGNQNDSFLYADYYFLDALNEYQDLAPSFSAPEPASLMITGIPAVAVLIRRRRR